MIKQILISLGQGSVLLLVFMVVFSAAYAAVYLTTWGRNPHWYEAMRSRYKLRYLPDNRFWPWLHQDTQYWCVRVNFKNGPVVLEGRSPHCRYWSANYYPAKGENFSIDTLSMRLNEHGEYRVLIGYDVQDSVVDQTIKVPSGVRHAVVEVRYTLQDVTKPLILPNVYQNGMILLAGQTR